MWLNRVPDRRELLSLLIAVIVALLLCLTRGTSAQTTPDSLEQGFKTPPESGRPRTWWHWTRSDVTKEGITKDLEWMKRSGIAGFQLADVNAGGGQSVDNKIVFWTPEWFDAVRHAASEAGRLGLEMTIFSSAGWSETGGPWVKPEQAMKKLVWSETRRTGPQTFSVKLPQPPSINGPFRNYSTTTPRPGTPADPAFYADAAVLAFRTPPDENDSVRPQVTTNEGPVDGAPLLDDDLTSALTINAPKDGSAAWVQYEYPQPFKARSISITGRGGIPVGRVQASENGRDFKTLVTLPGAQLYRGGLARTFSFPETAAKFYRIEITGAPIRPAAVMDQSPPVPAPNYVLLEAILHSDSRVHRWEEKAGFSFLFEYESVPTPTASIGSIINGAEIIDITSHLDKDGTLNWEVPDGNWTILRLGYSLTGSKNRPAVPAGLGYEVDKLSPKHLDSYLRGYSDPLAKALGPLYGKSLRYMLLDSWEAGMQNWTDDMPAEFRKRRGYDPTPYLPVLTGRVVTSAEVSDRFLWDFRRTLADMFAENHYKVATDFLRERGIGSYGEAAGVSLEIPEDTLLNKKHLDIPVGEFWMRDLHPFSMYYEDVRGTASAAHVYGKKIVATESFTGGGYDSPYALKKVVDFWFAQGVNRIIFHTSAHQPLDTKPGNTMVGTHINRNITWAEQSQPFMNYLARNSFMLQQGLFVADLAYLLPEGAPSTMPFWGSGLKPASPEGYDFDYVNADVLLNRMSVNGEGRIVLPDGMSYRVLVLPEVDRMTLPVLRKIRELVQNGATVIGPRPLRTPSLTGYPAADSELQELATELWADLDGVSRTKRRFGKGSIAWGLTPAEVMTSLKYPRDVEYGSGLDAKFSWIHRRTGDADIYYVANRSDQKQDVNFRFRVSGKEAELWHADTGEVDPAEYIIADGRTTVPLHLGERESVFVVFRRTASAPSRTLPASTMTTLATVSGPWSLSFPADLGAPVKIDVPELASWSVNSDEGVKYFSGTATYSKSVQIERRWIGPVEKIILDLGAVKDIAEVSLNGRSLGTVWKAPYQIDITSAVKVGANQLEIKVTNQWTNRIVGDRTAPAEKRILSLPATPGFGPPPTLVDAGLLGPVRIVSRK